ncbi:hypothetical protein F4604DRAFT_1690502 [Suillus subluteus]|nr:hypothetical protein F4604DRAFT_1690502 [Suillus subluteus]
MPINHYHFINYNGGMEHAFKIHHFQSLGIFGIWVMGVTHEWEDVNENIDESEKYTGVEIVDQYQELMRASQQWRDLINRKQFGFGHDTEVKPGAGDLALFCVACSQPGINIPINWQDEYERCSLCPHYNLWLASLGTHNESKEIMYTRGPLAAITMQSMQQTQIKIFRRVNGCQWCINFSEQVNNFPGLSLSKKKEVLTAVGKFHLSAHKLPCFARFSFNFIKGAGQVDGEILETLWAPFNKISPTARSMSQYHQQEILDDHMRDSNWKNWLGSVIKTLLKKYKCAVKGVNDTKLPFDELACSLDPQKIALWEKDEKITMELQGEHLDIYQLKIDKGRPGSVSWIIQGINLEDSQDGL